ncbi:MAG TPA: FMN-binding protein [Candidatus Saccharimonadales bacterium]|jgi:uncharacterized protein with FMN-binding domain|nr:FMN-binding protein [Candidatus Saccharimonadales bacterium]
MKKLAAGVAILFIFLVYSLGIRHQNPIIAKPKSLDNTSPATSTSTGSSTAGTTSSSSSTSSNGSSTVSTTPTPNSTPTPTSTGQYKDGIYTGDSYNAYYGNVQVSVTITGGKITSVKFLQYPNTHSTSVYINNQAMPYLQQEAIQAQSSNVQLISGATFTSQAFVQSLQSALTQAK